MIAPEFLPMLEALAQITPMHQRSVEEARAMWDDFIFGEPEALETVRDLTLPGPAGPIPARLYLPSSAPDGMILYLHGGGWVVGSIATHDLPIRAIANRTNCAMLAIEYRLAPEAPFPAGLDDSFAALEWIGRNRDDLRIAGKPLLVAGDSAGGNLAAALAISARDRKGPGIDGQLLLYPVTDGGCDSPSYRERASGGLLSDKDMVWYWNHYAPEEEQRFSPLASVLRAGTLSGLPPAIVVTAEFDPLRDEGIAYASALKAAGVMCTHRHYADLPHGFITEFAHVPSAGRALDDIAAMIKSLVKGEAFRDT